LTLTGHILAGRHGLAPGSRSDTLRPDGGFYDLVALIGTDRFARFALPEPRLDAARCDGCRWCIYECPAHNIRLEAYPVLGQECIRCYRCLTGCPQKAFSANWGIANLLILSAYNASFERWFGDLEEGEPIY
jgi:ferredoxin